MRKPSRAIDKYFPYAFATFPLEASVAMIAATSVIDYAEGIISDGDYPVTLNASKTVNLALIEGRYFIYNKGEGYYRDYKACVRAGLVRAKVHRFPSDAIMIENLYTLHGITPEEMKGRDDSVDQQLDEVIQGFRDNPEFNDMFVLESMSEIGGQKIKTSGVEMSITSYLSNYPTIGAASWPRIPMLTGGTGIAKTSIIESIISKVPSKWGYRLVTLKSGFIDKSDLMGYVKVENVTIDGVTKRVANESPMKELLTSTDSFVQSCRDLVMSANPDFVGPRTAEDEKVFQTAVEYAKTPVLFWDELNRTDPAILPQIMVIVCSKRLNNYKFELAPMLAAVNANTKRRGKDYLDDMYKVAEIKDPAMIDRFPPLEMDPSDPSLLGSFQETMMKKWGGKIPAIDVLMQKLNETKVNSIGLLYNDTLYVNADTPGADLTYELKFPTFRGWDMVFDYMYSKMQLNKAINLEFIKGIIGSEAADDLFEILKTNIEFKGLFDVKKNPGKNLHGLFLEDSFDSGTPVLLTGRFGMAKTAKITDEIKKRNGVVLNCDLSAQDKVTIRGMPNQQSLKEVMFGSSGTSPLALKMAEITANDPYFPQFTTVNTPFNFAFTVQKCINEGTMLCLVFDEINRCSPIVMSGVFDAISDKKFLGVDLKPLYEKRLIRIIAAGNVGDLYDVGEGERDMDAAVMARFASARVDKLDSTDVESFMGYARKAFLSKDGVASPFLTVLQNIPVDKILALLSLENIDEDDLKLGANLSSFRTLTYLDSKIKTNEGYMFKFQPSAPMDINVNDYYLGFQYGDGIFFEDNDGEDISYKDFLLKVRSQPDFYTEDEILLTMGDAENTMYNTYWKKQIYSNYSTREQTEMYQTLVLAVEKAMFAKYNVYEVTAKTIEAHIVMAASSKEVQSLSNPAMVGMIVEQCIMKINCDIKNKVEPLTSGGFKALIQEAVEGANGRVNVQVNDSDYDLILSKLLQVRTEIVDDQELKPQFGSTITVNDSYYNAAEGDLEALIAKLSVWYDLDADPMTYPYNSEEEVNSKSCPLIGLYDTNMTSTTIWEAWIAASQKANAGATYYTLISGQNLTALHFYSFPAKSGLAVYRRLRMKEGVGFKNTSLNFSMTDYSGTPEGAKNIITNMAHANLPLATFEGVEGGVQLLLSGFCLPLSTNPKETPNLMVRLQENAAVALKSVTGNPMDALLAVEAELATSDMPYLDAEILAQTPIQFTLQKWTGAIASAFSIINASFKKV